jgi:uncharacterized RDD family membrane protein YckC
MGEWAGSWLPGSQTTDTEGSAQQWQGERLGLPENGAGSVASVGRRVAAFLVDAVIAAGVASVFTFPEFPKNWSLLSLFVIYVIAVSFFGFTPGMAVLGVRVVRLDGARMVGPLRAMLRTALIYPLIPAVVWDADGRGLHDKAVGTVVVRMR